MLLRGAGDAAVGRDHQHGVVRRVARQAEHGGLQVLAVSGQVNEGDQLGGLLADLLRRGSGRVVDRVTLPAHRAAVSADTRSQH